MVIFTIDQDGREFEVESYVGKKLVQYSGKTVRVQADGDELFYIQQRFLNIPFINKTTVIWRGSFAQFIWDNWERL